MTSDDTTGTANTDEAGRPLETGWLDDTPADDNIVRGFTLAQAALDAELALAMGGRVDDDGEVALADSSGPVPYFNQAVLLRPLESADDPQLARIESFFAKSEGRPRTLLSMWPTPDLSTRGWSLVGHPAFCVRAPGPHANPRAEGVTIETVTTPERLAVAERDRGRRLPDGRARGIAAGHVAPRGGARHRRRVPHRIGRRRAGRDRTPPHRARHGEPLPRRDAARGTAGAVCGRRSCGPASTTTPSCPRSRTPATTAAPASSAWASCPSPDSPSGSRPADMTGTTTDDERAVLAAAIDDARRRSTSCTR